MLISNFRSSFFIFVVFGPVNSIVILKRASVLNVAKHARS